MLVLGVLLSSFCLSCLLHCLYLLILYRSNYLPPVAVLTGLYTSTKLHGIEWMSCIDVCSKTVRKSTPMEKPKTKTVRASSSWVSTEIDRWRFTGVLSWYVTSVSGRLCHHTYTHTHTHPFNGSFSGTTQVSRYQKGKTNLDFTEARGSKWQWHQLGHMHVCTSLQTDNHASTPPLSFLQVGRPSCRPTNSVKALKAVPFYSIFPKTFPSKFRCATAPTNMQVSLQHCTDTN